MPSIAARFTNLLFRLIPADKPGEPHDYAAERKRNDREPPKLPDGVILEQTDLNGIPGGEKLSKPGNKKGTVFYIHGGGFTTGSAKERRMLTQYIADRFGYDVIAVNYRLSPENKWPAHLEDCFTAYENLLKTVDPGEIVFMGESAGGTLALSLALLAKEKGLPLPKAVAAFSPATENSGPLPSHTANIRTDTMLKDAVSKGLANVLFDHEPEETELKDPMLSPYYGDYTGIPPVFLSASDTETLYDDSVVLYNKLSGEGHNVRLETEHGVCHAYQMMTYLPEARRTLERCFDFIDLC